VIEISPLQTDVRVRGEELARDYKEFYRTEVSDDEYERTWQRLLQVEDLFGVARLHWHTKQDNQRAAALRQSRRLSRVHPL
jgi:hypothetical protein